MTETKYSFGFVTRLCRCFLVWIHTHKHTHTHSLTQTLVHAIARAHTHTHTSLALFMSSETRRWYYVACGPCASQCAGRSAAIHWNVPCRVSRRELFAGVGLPEGSCVWDVPPRLVVRVVVLHCWESCEGDGCCGFSLVTSLRSSLLWRRL